MDPNLWKLPLNLPVASLGEVLTSCWGYLGQLCKIVSLEDVEEMVTIRLGGSPVSVHFVHFYRKSV